MVEPLKIKSNQFVKEQTGNIKDFYKITSCIGRGTETRLVTIIRGLWRGEEVPA